MNIRFACLNDLERCLDLDLHKKKEQIKNKIINNEVIVCDIYKDIVACLKIEYIWTHVPFISYIVIDENFKNKNISRKLLDFLKEFLKVRGYNYLLSSTMTNAVNAQNWHKHMGFEECGFISSINSGVGELFYILKF